MVKYSSAALDRTFAALSDQTRRGILARLAQGNTSVSDLAAPYDMSLPAVSKHLRVLEDAGLVERQKSGRVYHCSLTAAPMKGAAEWIAHYRKFWEQQFDSLARYLAETEKKEKTQWQLPPRDPLPGSKSDGRSERRVKKSSRRGRTRKQ
jgi:DNA-binding transcriptional ArsR family regulator